MMKTAVLAMSLFIGGIAFGQANGTNATSAENAVYLTTRMTQDLHLDATQAQQISDINLGIAQKNEQVRTATNMTPEEKQSVLLSNDDARKKMYQGILTDAQYNQQVAIEVTHPVSL